MTIEGPHPGKRCDWHCGLGTCTAPPLIPPPWFVAQWNERGLAGAPSATALDPLVMFSWHLAAKPPAMPLIVTGI